MSELLGAISHQFVDTLILRFGQTDAGCDAWIEKTGIAALRIKIDQLNRFGGLVLWRIRIGERFLIVLDHLDGFRWIFGGIGNIAWTRKSDFLKRGFLFFVGWLGSWRGFRRSGRSGCGFSGRSWSWSAFLLRRLLHSDAERRACAEEAQGQGYVEKTFT